MEQASRRSVTQLTDPVALRALAHPTRLALVGLLRREGPLTATRAGELLGESSGSTSFHLRQLAKYGLVEEAGGGQGREKPWRATTMFTGWETVPANPESAAAAELLVKVIVDQYLAKFMRWREVRAREPEEWQDAAQFGDTFLYVTAEELTDLNEKVGDLLDPYLDRSVRPELRPPGSRLVSYLHIVHPVIAESAGNSSR